MDWDTVKGNWKQHRSKLTDDRIRQACDISKEKAGQQVQSVESHSIN